MIVTKEEIRSARTADLFELLLRFHPNEFKKEGYWLRMKSHPAICMKRGCGGYKDYATFETGNSIDFLVRYMNYSFEEAVSRLTSQTSAVPRQECTVRQIVFPEQAENDFAVRRYLSGRGFPDMLITELESADLLYQDTNRNAVFRSTAGDFYELRGTWPGKPFHQCRKKTPDCFWSYTPNGKPEKAYICESSIDALSLYLLHMRSGMRQQNNVYCGIAGVANQQTIDRIKQWCPAVIAVDNDAAGEQCRQRNSDLPAVIPQRKDWNEDLIAITQTKAEE